MADVVEVPRTALAKLVAVAAHVSLGAGAAFIVPYPDVAARYALGELDDAGLLDQFRPQGFRPAVEVELSDEEAAELTARLEAAIADGTAGFTVAPPDHLDAAFEAHADESLALANEAFDAVVESWPDYAEKVNAPLSPETVEALRKELASGNPARFRKTRDAGVKTWPNG